MVTGIERTLTYPYGRHIKRHNRIRTLQNATYGAGANRFIWLPSLGLSTAITTRHVTLPSFF